VAVVCSWCEEGASTSFVRISCGDHHTAAVTRDGQVILAGDNDFGELGKVSLLPSNPPLLVIYVSVSSLCLSSSPNLCFFSPVSCLAHVCLAASTTLRVHSWLFSPQVAVWCLQAFAGELCQGPRASASSGPFSERLEGRMSGALDVCVAAACGLSWGLDQARGCFGRLSPDVGFDT